MKTKDGRVLRKNRRDLLKTRESYAPRETSNFYDQDGSTFSSKVFPPTKAASIETSPSQAANSETQDGAIRPYYIRSSSKRFQDNTIFCMFLKTSILRNMTFSIFSASSIFLYFLLQMIMYFSCLIDIVVVLAISMYLGKERCCIMLSLCICLVFVYVSLVPMCKVFLCVTPFYQEVFI